MLKHGLLRTETIPAYNEEIGGSARAMANLGPEAFPVVFEALRDSDRNIQRIAAETCIFMKDRRAVGPLAQRLRNLKSSCKPDEEMTREMCVQWLALLGGPDASAALVEALKDPDRNMREAAAGALGDCGEVSAVPALLVVLKESNTQIRENAAESLGQLGDKQAVPALQKLLNDPEESVRDAARDAMEKLGQ
jgi:HEAT repeat protein